MNLTSATKDSVEILGIKAMPIRLYTTKKSGLMSFYHQVIVCKNLHYKAILGVDFMQRFGAIIDLKEYKLVLNKTGIKSVHKIYPSEMVISVNVITTQDEFVEGKLRQD